MSSPASTTLNYSLASSALACCGIIGGLLISYFTFSNKTVSKKAKKRIGDTITPLNPISSSQSKAITNIVDEALHSSNPLSALQTKLQHSPSSLRNVIASYLHSSELAKYSLFGFADEIKQAKLADRNSLTSMRYYLFVEYCAPFYHQQIRFLDADNLSSLLRDERPIDDLFSSSCIHLSGHLRRLIFCCCCDIFPEDSEEFIKLSRHFNNKKLSMNDLKNKLMTDTEDMRYNIWFILQTDLLLKAIRNNFAHGTDQPEENKSLKRLEADAKSKTKCPLCSDKADCSHRIEFDTLRDDIFNSTPPFDVANPMKRCHTRLVSSLVVKCADFIKLQLIDSPSPPVTQISFPSSPPILAPAPKKQKTFLDPKTGQRVTTSIYDVTPASARLPYLSFDPNNDIILCDTHPLCAPGAFLQHDTYKHLETCDNPHLWCVRVKSSNTVHLVPLSKIPNRFVRPVLGGGFRCEQTQYTSCNQFGSSSDPCQKGAFCTFVHVDSTTLSCLPQHVPQLTTSPAGSPLPPLLIEFQNLLQKQNNPFFDFVLLPSCQNSISTAKSAVVGLGDGLDCFYKSSTNNNQTHWNLNYLHAVIQLLPHTIVESTMRKLKREVQICAYAIEKLVDPTTLLGETVLSNFLRKKRTNSFSETIWFNRAVISGHVNGDFASSIFDGDPHAFIKNFKEAALSRDFYFQEKPVEYSDNICDIGLCASVFSLMNESRNYWLHITGFFSEKLPLVRNDQISTAFRWSASYYTRIFHLLHHDIMYQLQFTKDHQRRAIMFRQLFLPIIGTNPPRPLFVLCNPSKRPCRILLRDKNAKTHFNNTFDASWKISDQARILDNENDLLSEVALMKTPRLLVVVIQSSCLTKITRDDSLVKLAGETLMLMFIRVKDNNSGSAAAPVNSSPQQVKDSLLKYEEEKVLVKSLMFWCKKFRSMNYMNPTIDDVKKVTRAYETWRKLKVDDSVFNCGEKSSIGAKTVIYPKWFTLNGEYFLNRLMIEGQNREREIFDRIFFEDISNYNISTFHSLMKDNLLPFLKEMRVSK